MRAARRPGRFRGGETVKPVRIISDCPENVERELEAIVDYTVVQWGVTADQNGAVTVTAICISNTLLRQAHLAAVPAMTQRRMM